MKNLILLLVLSSLFSSCNFHLFPKEVAPAFDSFYHLKSESLEGDSTTIICGRVTDNQSGEGLAFANVAVFTDSNQFITGTQTDFDGYYQIEKLCHGSYTFESAYVGYKKCRISGVVIRNGLKNQLDIQQRQKAFEEIGCGGGYKIPLIRADDFTQGRTFNADEIKRMAW